LVSTITEIIETLSDGKWHGIGELQQKVKIKEYEVQEVASFLDNYDFATVDDAKKKVKINKNFRKFLAKTTS